MVRLEEFHLDEFQPRNVYWDLFIRAEPTVTYGGEEGAPIVREVWKLGINIYESLTADELEQIQDAVTALWRHPVEPEHLQEIEECL